MDKKNFYGEYTLQHWVELILEKNIILPDYQRGFVWRKNHVERFLKNLKNGEFIPPVIIGSLQQESGHVNLIIDGQQRLTSILLGYLGVFPKEEAFNQHEDVENTPLYIGVDADDGDGEEEKPLQWNFSQITCDNRNKTKANILTNIEWDKYVRLENEVCLDDVFMNKAFQGFSYIIPRCSDESVQRKFYCNVFYDINQQGVVLQRIESRRALYYLDNELIGFFEPELCKMLKITQNRKVLLYDYVRSLAFLSEYAKTNNVKTIAKSCNSNERLELYYENYINAVIRDEDDPKFGKFSDIIGKEHIVERTDRLQSYIKDLRFNIQSFQSIINADTNLFGLIYYVMFQDKQLNKAKYSLLTKELTRKITNFTSINGTHRKSPNSLTYIRQRIKESINIYSRYIL